MIETSLVIPYIDNLDKRKYKRDIILSYSVDKLYVQSTDLKTTLAIIEAFEVYNVVETVGDVEKVEHLEKIRYRQRFYVKNFAKLLELCKKYTIEVNIEDNFRITLNAVYDFYEEIPKLYKYSKLSSLSLDDWLRNCFILQLHTYLMTLNYSTNIDIKKINNIIANTSFINRSPFLALGEGKYFSIIQDEGYSLKSVKADKKEGIFNEC